jgi:5-methylcytosine-specific restriction endonuclease McrA
MAHLRKQTDMAKNTRRCASCKTDISRRGNKSTRCKPCQAEARRVRERDDPAKPVCADADTTCSSSRLKRGRCSKHYYIARRDNGGEIPQRPRACVVCSTTFTPVRSDAEACSTICNWRKQDTLRHVGHGPRLCTSCGGLFKPTRRDQRYCRPECNPNPSVLATRRWAKRNKARIAELENRRRARGNGNPDSVPLLDRDWYRLVARHGNRCFYCGERLATDDLARDHVVPLARGGRHGIGNIVPACKECNSSKGALLLIEFRARRMAERANLRPARPRIRSLIIPRGPFRFEQVPLIAL